MSTLKPSLYSLFHIPKWLILLIAATTAAANTGAQLHGRVVDQSGAVVQGAIVRLSSREGMQWSVVTDEKGVFRFEQLKAGNYLLEVEARNFRRQVESLRLESNRDRTLDVTLQTAGVDEQMVITANGTAQPIDETSKSVTVIDKEEIERRDEYSLIEALREVPGLRVTQLGGPGAFSKIFIRGLRVVDTSLLIDGFRVRDAADFRGSANPLLEDLLTVNIERIEVLRGSGSSLYGSNAVGGVINIVPQEGAGSPKFSLGFEGGSLGFFRERAQLSGGAGSRLSYSLSAARLDVNNGVHDGEVYRNTSLGAHARYTIASNLSLRGTITFADSFKRLTDSPFPIGPAGNEFGFATGKGPVVGFIENQLNPDSFRDASLFSGSVALSHQASSIYSYSVSFQSVVTKRAFNNGPDQSAIAKKLGIFEFASSSHFNGRIDTFNWANNVRVGSSNLITAGLEAERESLTQDFSSAFFSTPRTTDRQHSLAFFAQDQLSLLEGSLQVSVAFRTQGFTIKNPESVPEVHNIDIKRALTGDGSIAYLFRKQGTKLRAHVGNSFRAPSLSERFSLFRGQRIGNPFLRPERGLSVDGGLDQELLQGRLRASATYFYNRLQEVITSTALFKTTNSRGALSRGFELSLIASPRPGLNVSAAYTYTNSAQSLASATLRSDNSLLPAGSTIQSFSIPRHFFSFEVNQRFRHGLEINFDLYSISKHNFPLFDPIFFSQVIFSFKGYTRADLVASHSRNLGESRQLTLYAKVANLFDQKIFEEGFRAPGVSGIGGIRFRF
jgi:vitamin B12 transporter